MSKIFMVFISIGKFLRFMVRMFILTLKHPPPKKTVIDQIYRIGVLSLPVVVFSGISTGMVLASHAYFTLQPIGMQSSVGMMVMKTVTVEIGPALTAFMITGRSGAAVAAELGSMIISEQVSAVQSMGIDPMWFFVLPRMVAGMIATPILSAFCSIGGIFGGYIASVLLFGISHSSFVLSISQSISRFDLFSGLIKSSIFGVIIFGICSYEGLKAKHGAEGVGKVTTRSVVISYMGVLFINFVITLIINAIGTYIE